MRGVIEEAAGHLPGALMVRRLAGTLIVDCPGAKTGPFCEVFESAAREVGFTSAVQSVGGGLVVLRVPRARRTLACEMTLTGATHLAVPTVLKPDHAFARLARTLQHDASLRRGRFRVSVSAQLMAWLVGEGLEIREALADAHPLLSGFASSSSLPADGFEIEPL